MKIKCFLAFMVVLFTLTFHSPSHGAVEMNIFRTLKLDAVPLDVVSSLNGAWIFVLTQKGEIHVYSSSGILDDKVPVDPSIDRIQVGPREDILFLTSTQNKTVQIVTVEFIKGIDVTDAPYKGREDAPVVIAVFNDFE